MPPASNTAGIQRLGPSSTEAVMAMATSITHMRGVAKAALNISPRPTPARTPSVAGKGCASRSHPYASVGTRMRPSLSCQAPNPTASKPKLPNPPITTPPGNQTWNRLSLTVLFSG